MVEFLRGIGQRHGRTPGQVAIAWTLANPAITGAIVGFRSPQQVAGILDGAEYRLSQSELGEIEQAMKQETAA